MEKSTREELLQLARKTAKTIRKRTQIQGWHENESRFPESDYEDVLRMLEEAYLIGRTSTRRQSD